MVTQENVLVCGKFILTCVVSGDITKTERTSCDSSLSYGSGRKAFSVRPTMSLEVWACFKNLKNGDRRHTSISELDVTR